MPTNSRPDGTPFAECCVCEGDIYEAMNAKLVSEQKPTETESGRVHYRHAYCDPAEGDR